MNCNISTAPDFDRGMKALAKKYASIKEDYSRLLSDLKENPQIGSYLGHNLRKVRMRITSKAKGSSGGARVISHYVIISEEASNLTLLYVYDKSERSTIKDNELIALLKKNGLT